MAEGAAFVYFGSPGEGIFTTSYEKGSGQAEAKLGWSVSSAGDVNGDGRDDIIVGARDYDGGQENEGRATLYYGMPDVVVQAFLPITKR